VAALLQRVDHEFDEELIVVDDQYARHEHPRRILC
jgi:hypothetical protein